MMIESAAAKAASVSPMFSLVSLILLLLEYNIDSQIHAERDKSYTKLPADN